MQIPAAPGPHASALNISVCSRPHSLRPLPHVIDVMPLASDEWGREAEGKAAGLAAHPTGVEHGTITAVAEGLPVEVTTLRADIATGQRPRVNTAPGVAYLVSVGDQPAAVADSIIDEIKGREDDDGFIRLGRGQRFSQGDPVKISDGALCNHIGLFHCVTDNDRVIILLDLLGRQTRVKVPLDSLVSRDF